MNELYLNIMINFCSETETSEQMATELKNHGLLSVIRQCMQSNPNAISVAAFSEEAGDCLANLYNNTKLNLWAEED